MKEPKITFQRSADILLLQVAVEQFETQALLFRLAPCLN